MTENRIVVAASRPSIEFVVWRRVNKAESRRTWYRTRPEKPSKWFYESHSHPRSRFGDNRCWLWHSQPSGRCTAESIHWNRSWTGSYIDPWNRAGIPMSDAWRDACFRCVGRVSARREGRNWRWRSQPARRRKVSTDPWCRKNMMRVSRSSYNIVVSIWGRLGVKVRWSLRKALQKNLGVIFLGICASPNSLQPPIVNPLQLAP